MECMNAQWLQVMVGLPVTVCLFMFDRRKTVGLEWNRLNWPLAFF